MQNNGRNFFKGAIAMASVAVVLTGLAFTECYQQRAAQAAFIEKYETRLENLEKDFHSFMEESKTDRAWIRDSLKRIEANIKEIK